MPNPAADPADIASFITDVGPEVRHIVERADAIWDQHEIVSQPTSVLVAADGTTERIPSFGRAGLVIRLERLAATATDSTG